MAADLAPYGVPLLSLAPGRNRADPTIEQNRNDVPLRASGTKPLTLCRSRLQRTAVRYVENSSSNGGRFCLYCFMPLML